MSSKDVQKNRFIDELIRISALSRQTGYPLPCQFESPIGEIDIPGWLAGVEGAPKWYWKNHDGQFEVGGIGEAFSLNSDESGPAFRKAQQIQDMIPGPSPIFLGGRQFSLLSKTDDTWKGYPQEICFIPERMIIRRNSTYSLAFCLKVTATDDVNVLLAKSEMLYRQSVGGILSVPTFNDPQLAHQKHLPDFDHWRQNIEQSLKAITSGQIEKIVLARRTDYQFEEKIDPSSLLACLVKQNHKCFAIMYQPQPGTAFISVTPERLYRRREREIEIDALSSTLPRGVTPKEDDDIGTKLLSSSKLMREHRAVIEGITQAVSPLVIDNPVVGGTSVLKLDRIQHLATSISGDLEMSIGDDEIISALHPTPAVGGKPRAVAIEMIEKLEEFDRGWYAAPIGYMANDQAEFAVGIRSLLIRGKTVSVFVGAGIVDGSDPETEWREIDSKDVFWPLLSGVETQ